MPTTSSDANAAAANGAALPNLDAPPPAAAPAPAAASATKGAVGGAAMLARLRAQRASKTAAAAASKPKSLTILFASQTGTAAEIAKNIHTEAESRGLKSQVAPMNDFGFDNITADRTPVVILVASSTGDGDAPDNAAKFFAGARRRTHANDLLKGVAFTCLGLGDSNYTRFMAVPRSLRSRFTEMGAATFYPGIDADEVDGIEDIVDKWIAGLWPALQAAVQVNAPPANGAAAAAGAAASPALPAVTGGMTGVPPLPKCSIKLAWQVGEAAEAVRQQEAAGPSAAEVQARDESGMYSPERPFWAEVTAARYLTTPACDEDRKVLHMELDVGTSGMVFSPGDSIGVLPHNSPALVDALLTRLGADPAAVFAVASVDEAEAGGAALLHHLRWPCTLRAALLRGVELTSAPRKSLLRVLAEHCSAAAERQKLLLWCSRDGREAYAAHILAARPTLLDLLSDFPSCNPPLDALLDALPPLPPRMYSLACSPLETPGRVHVAFSLVRYTSAAGPREGVATAWLQGVCAPVAAGEAGTARVPVFLRKGGAFQPPTDLAAPWIMIGPGTGVAPFRGFLQERRARLAALQGGEGAGAGAAVAECWLYFGCRRADQDFLYEQELREFEADGTLTRLEVAFSRAQEEKVYVQHLMAQRAEQLYSMVERQGGFVFVCGDGAAMAKDVHAALVDVLVKQGGLTEAAAGAKLAELAQQGRYVRDIWS